MNDPSKEPAAWNAVIWGGLESAPGRRKHPWRTPALSTVSPDGAPEVRLVVLRHAAAATRILEFYTDSASNKYDSLRREKRFECCFWNPRAREQVRLSGQCIVVPPEACGDVWKTLSHEARKAYLINPAPGTPIPSPSDLSFDGSGRFSRLRCVVDQIDALALIRNGHRRMIGRWTTEGWSLNWVTP